MPWVNVYPGIDLTEVYMQIVSKLIAVLIASSCAGTDPLPLVLPLCEERPCIDLDCSDFSVPGCFCILSPDGLGILCAPGYVQCAPLECEGLQCTIPNSNSCLCLRANMPPVPCSNGGPAG